MAKKAAKSAAKAEESSEAKPAEKQLAKPASRSTAEKAPKKAASTAVKSGSSDDDRTELRTLEIGRELFGRVQHRSPSIFHGRWWEDRLM